MVKAGPKLIENWKDIPGYEGVYQVSDLGRVRSLDMIVGAVHGGTARRKGRILAQTVTNSGYLKVAVSVSNQKKNFLVHRLVAEAFCEVSADFEPEVINHLDGNRENNCATNLEWTTQQQNIRHYHNILKPNRKT